MATRKSTTKSPTKPAAKPAARRTPAGAAKGHTASAASGDQVEAGTSLPIDESKPAADVDQAAAGGLESGGHVDAGAPPAIPQGKAPWYDRPGVRRHRVVSPLRMHHKRFAVGDTLTLTEDEAAPLLGHTVTPHDD